MPKCPGDGPAAPRPHVDSARPSDKRGPNPNGGSGGSGAAACKGKEKEGPVGPIGGSSKDIDMECQDDDRDDSMPDTSIDTETWDLLGIKSGDLPGDKEGTEPGALAVLDTAGSSPSMARSLEAAFDQYGSNLKVVSATKLLPGAT